MSSFRIRTNVSALRAYYALENVNQKTLKAQLRIASGKRINRVADDTSGFNVGKSLEGRISIMNGAINNVVAAKDMLATAEGALLGVSDLLVKLEGKISDAQNPTSDRGAIAADMKALAQEIQATLDQTRYNKSQILTDNATNDVSKGYTFQVGAEISDTIKLDYATDMVSTNATAFNAALDSWLTVTEANITSSTVLSDLSARLGTLTDNVNTTLGNIGNFTQRLDIKEDTLGIAVANAQSSYSRLFDADIALEQLNATKGQILGQSATAMVSQLNIQPQNVLSLFG